MTSTEYGVRSWGGHVEAMVSRHVAVREIQRRQAAGERVSLVKREVTDWEEA